MLWLLCFQKLHKKASSSSPSFTDDTEQMQADAGWNDYSGGGYNSYDKPRGGGTYYGNTVDDEDYSDDYSGSGYGSEGSGGYRYRGRNKGKNPKYDSKFG